jgi:hypothetical protein
MKTEFIVMTASAKMPSSCKGVYRKVAILEVLKGVTPKMISERARGVIRIVALNDRLHAGRDGSRTTAYGKAKMDAERVCAGLNREARMKHAREMRRALSNAPNAEARSPERRPVPARGLDDA